MRSQAIVAVLVLGLLAACGEDPVSSGTRSVSPTASPTAATPDPAPGPSPSRSRATREPQPGTTVMAAGSDVGTILFDDTGQAIYLFDVETTSRPRCYGPCADAWPPVLTEGAPRAGAQVRESLLGTTERTDGTSQVTYDGHPLYFYAHEGKGEVECHDVFLNGGTWYAVAPNGRRALS